MPAPSLPPLRDLPGALRREGVLRATTRRLNRDLAQAGRDGRPVLVGPWLSEIGFEVLYWIPLVRKLAQRHGLAPEQMTAISRGGAEPWYRDLCSGYVDVLDLVSSDVLRAANRHRALEADSQKQLTVTAFDREILRRAGGTPGHRPTALVHPLLMYGRLRYLWAGQEPMRSLSETVEYAPMARPELPSAVEDELPDGYAAVKVYFSDCFPENEENRRFASALVGGLRELGDVVLLSAGVELDEHRDFRVEPSGGLHDASRWMNPRDNLAVQTAIVGGARSLWATYGGFSYLGPFLGVPTASFYSERNFLPAHLEAMAHAAADLGRPAPRVSAVSSLPTSSADLRAVEAALSAPRP